MDPHLSLLNRCVGPRDSSVLVARCTRAGGSADGVIMLTRRRVVVTEKSRVLRRLRLHLNFELHQLSDVSWTPEPALGGVALAATAIDGVRERFWIEAGDVHYVDRVLTEVFRATPVLAA